MLGEQSSAIASLSSEGNDCGVICEFIWFVGCKFETYTYWRHAKWGERVLGFQVVNVTLNRH